MKRTHPGLWAFGWFGIAVGAAMSLIGLVGQSELTGLTGGYGMLVLVAAVYLLGGLALRGRLSGRVRSQEPMPASTRQVATRS